MEELITTIEESWLNQEIKHELLKTISNKTKLWIDIDLVVTWELVELLK